MQAVFQRRWPLVATACAVAAVLATLPPTAWARCKPDCASTASVVHAAGVPSDLRLALQRLEFNGSGLAAGDAAVVSDIVRALAALPAGTQVALTTRADSGLAGAAATRQAQARARALEKAVRAGLKAAGAKDAVLTGIAAGK